MHVAESFFNIVWVDIDSLITLLKDRNVILWKDIHFFLHLVFQWWQMRAWSSISFNPPNSWLLWRADIWNHIHTFYSDLLLPVDCHMGCCADHLYQELCADLKWLSKAGYTQTVPDKHHNHQITAISFFCSGSKMLFLSRRLKAKGSLEKNVPNSGWPPIQLYQPTNRNASLK